MPRDSTSRVDSDDWLNSHSCSCFARTIQKHLQSAISRYNHHFVYDKVNEASFLSGTCRIQKSALLQLVPSRQFYGAQWCYASLHYRPTKLGNHEVATSHVLCRNILLLHSTSKMHRIYYIDTYLYHYFIVAKDQSVNQVLRPL